jgi:hypothetical protein
MIKLVHCSTMYKNKVNVLMLSLFGMVFCNSSNLFLVISLCVFFFNSQNNLIWWQTKYLNVKRVCCKKKCPEFMLI